MEVEHLIPNSLINGMLKENLSSNLIRRKGAGPEIILYNALWFPWELYLMFS